MNKHSLLSSMGKRRIEICLISARGLPRASLLKYQWYAVGWIDPSNKYCTKIDTSGNANPVWKTKFTTVIDTSETDFLDVALHVEVYSREPLFLREKLQGTATIILKEFLAKHSNNTEGAKPENEDVGSFQLRKKISNKPQGFIDISVKVSEEKEGTSSYSFLGEEEGFNLQDNSGITLATGPMQGYTGGKAEPPFHLSGNPRPPAAHPYAHPVPYPRNYSHPSIGMPNYPPATGPSYPRPYAPPPPPPPPSNAGYVPTFLPQTNNQSTSYLNMPSSGYSGGAGRGVGPAFGVGMGAGALAAGAVIFGDDLMTGFDLPTGMRDASLTMATNLPF